MIMKRPASHPGGRRIFRWARLVCLGLAWTALLTAPVRAEQRPKTPDELVANADLVLVGRIVDFRITKERSTVERTFGNYDWIIDVTIEPGRVEKGSAAPGVPITASCFRPKSRLSVAGYIGLGGQRPIPPAGTEVRAHLRKNGDRWSVVYPNGFASVDGQETLADAPEIHALLHRGWRFTYGLPIELWILFVAVNLLVLAGWWVVRRLLAWRRARSRSSPGAGS
jgi:hypothetical protein